MAGARSRILAWTLFDFANTAYSVVIVTLVYALYFQKIVAGASGQGDFYWGIAVSLSMLLSAILAPPLGAAADSSQRKKRFLFAFTMASVAATGALWFVREGMIVVGTLIFIVANVGFEGGIVFYDAFLPSLTSPRSYGRVSGYGFAMGYLGAFAILAITFPLVSGGFTAENLPNVRLSFVIAAAFFLVFSVPMFLALHEPKVARAAGLNFIRDGMRRSMTTLRHIRQHPNVAWFLAAFFLYNDGILTIISFAALFASTTLGFTVGELVIFFLVVQSTAVLGSVVFGIITDHIGPQRTITITLAIWIVVVAAGVFADSKVMFYAVGLVTGLAIGSSQSASRSLMALLTPKEREAEFFGFYDGFCGKASAVFGPFLFGLISRLAGQRFALASVALFFVAGFVLLRNVRVARP